MIKTDRTCTTTELQARCNEKDQRKRIAMHRAIRNANRVQTTLGEWRRKTNSKIWEFWIREEFVKVKK